MGYFQTSKFWTISYLEIKSELFNYRNKGAMLFEADMGMERVGWREEGRLWKDETEREGWNVEYL